MSILSKQQHFSKMATATDWFKKSKAERQSAVSGLERIRPMTWKSGTFSHAIAALTADKRTEREEVAMVELMLYQMFKPRSKKTKGKGWEVKRLRKKIIHDKWRKAIHSVIAREGITARLEKERDAAGAIDRDGSSAADHVTAKQPTGVQLGSYSNGAGTLGAWQHWQQGVGLAGIPQMASLGPSRVHMGGVRRAHSSVNQHMHRQGCNTNTGFRPMASPVYNISLSQGASYHSKVQQNVASLSNGRTAVASVVQPPESSSLGPNVTLAPCPASNRPSPLPDISKLTQADIEALHRFPSASHALEQRHCESDSPRITTSHPPPHLSAAATVHNSPPFRVNGVSEDTGEARIDSALHTVNTSKSGRAQDSEAPPQRVKVFSTPPLPVNTAVDAQEDKTRTASGSEGLPERSATAQTELHSATHGMQCSSPTGDGPRLPVTVFTVPPIPVNVDRCTLKARKTDVSTSPLEMDRSAHCLTKSHSVATPTSPEPSVRCLTASTSTIPSSSASQCNPPTSTHINTHPPTSKAGTALAAQLQMQAVSLPVHSSEPRTTSCSMADSKHSSITAVPSLVNTTASDSSHSTLVHSSSGSRSALLHPAPPSTSSLPVTVPGKTNSQCSGHTARPVHVSIDPPFPVNSPPLQPQTQQVAQQLAHLEPRSGPVSANIAPSGMAPTSSGTAVASCALHRDNNRGAVEQLCCDAHSTTKTETSAQSYTPPGQAGMTWQQWRAQQGQEEPLVHSTVSAGSSSSQGVCEIQPAPASRNQNRGALSATNRERAMCNHKSVSWGHDTVNFFFPAPSSTGAGSVAPTEPHNDGGLPARGGWTSGQQFDTVPVQKTTPSDLVGLRTPLVAGQNIRLLGAQCGPGLHQNIGSLTGSQLASPVKQAAEASLSSPFPHTKMQSHVNGAVGVLSTPVASPSVSHSSKMQLFHSRPLQSSSSSLTQTYKPSLRDASVSSTSVYCSTEPGDCVACSSLASLQTTNYGSSNPSSMRGTANYAAGHLKAHSAVVPGMTTSSAVPNRVPTASQKLETPKSSSRVISSFGRNMSVSSVSQSQHSVAQQCQHQGQNSTNAPSEGASGTAADDVFLVGTDLNLQFAATANRSKRRITAYPVNLSLGSVSQLSVSSGG